MANYDGNNCTDSSAALFINLLISHILELRTAENLSYRYSCTFVHIHMERLVTLQSADLCLDNRAKGKSLAYAKGHWSFSRPSSRLELNIVMVSLSSSGTNQ